MTKHSKNNTASSIFSYAEYKKLDYGTKRQRLGNESMKPFDACGLCLQHARDPMACHSGHVFCKECIYTDLLTQKKAIKKQELRIQALLKEEEAEKLKTATAARERVIWNFERGQNGMGLTDEAQEQRQADDSRIPEPRGVKRKFELDKSRMESAAKEAEETALHQIEREQMESRKAKLPDFWLPSLQPDAKAAVQDYKDVKLRTTCNASAPPHPLTLKNLVSITFAYDTSSSEKGGTKICPSCKKSLSNSILSYFLKSCSHVVCKTCRDALVIPAGQCVVCDQVIQPSDVIQFNREGTGYAGGGRAETSKAGIAFQG